jgi:amino acid adenylation domain-containing protein
MLRVRLVRLAPDDHVMVAVTHHIVSDGWSMGVFVHELGVLYTAYRAQQPSPLPELAIQYADYARWERRHLQGEVLERQLAHWRERLAAPVAALDLPMAGPRPPVQTHAGAEVHLRLPTATTAALRRLAETEQATLFMVLLAAFKVLLFRHSGQADVVVGTPVANRTRLALEGMIGFFANTLVLRSDLAGNPAFRELLQRVKTAVLDADAHQEIPFDKLVEELRPARDASRNPFFQAMFALQHTDAVLPRMAGIEVSVPPRVESAQARFDLTATFRDSGGELELRLEYNTDLFERAAMEALVARYAVLLEAIGRHPEQPIGALALLPADERERVMERWNDTAAPRDTATFATLFAARALQAPQAVALSFEGVAVGYGELDARANRLAHELRALGVGPGVPVGLCLERGPELAVALVAIQKAGGAYVPLDPGFPAERLAYMLADSAAPVVVTSGDAAADVTVPDGVKVLDLGADAARIAAQPATAPASVAAPEDPAYIIYTSGSTGRPKGVAISHGALVNFLRSMQREPGLAADDVVAAVTTISFDIAGLELYLPWLVGARVELVSREHAADGALLAQRLAESGATVLQATPATWRLLLEAGWQGDARLRALCGGEALSRELADALLPKVRELWNLYGPTETTIWSTAERVQPGRGAIGIGRPIDNTRVYVVDAGGEPVPVGVPGEIWIGGAGVALGYHRRDDLTAERFVQRFGARVYRTGDLGRWRADGRLEHLGRIDHQVKIRGFRIELGEIEAVLASHAAVKQCVVLARDAAPGDARLVAYVVYHPGEELTVTDVRRFLRRQVPDYMVPSVIVALDAIPLTPNGKIDRAAFPDPFRIPQRITHAAEPPAPGMEQMLAGIWSELLHADPIGAHDNFFELGGHSLLSLRVAVAVEQKTGWRMDPRTMFFQTLRQVAAAFPGPAPGRSAPQ